MYIYLFTGSCCMVVKPGVKHLGKLINLKDNNKLHPEKLHFTFHSQKLIFLLISSYEYYSIFWMLVQKYP